MKLKMSLETELLLESILKTIFFMFITSVIVYLTYRFSYFLAEKMNIENKIVPACSVMTPDLRGDWKIFSGLFSIEALIAFFVYGKNNGNL